MSKRKVVAFVIMLACCVVVADLLASSILHKRNSNQANLPVVTQLDSEIGWRNLPGSKVYNPEITNGHEVRITIQPDGARQNDSIPPPNTTDDQPTILFVGGSWTFGLGVSDNETYINLLQEWHPDHTLLNHGVIGYGTAQSYMKLQELLSTLKTTPRLVVYGFIQHHDKRNAGDREWFEGLAKAGQQGADVTLPYCSIKDGKLKWHTLTNNSKAGLLDKSILASAVKEKAELTPEEQMQAEEVTHQLTVNMGRLCKEHRTGLLVHFMSLDQDRFERFDEVLAKEQISSFPNSIKINDQEFESLWDPYHPSAQAHSLYATNLDHFLEQMGVWTATNTH